MFGGKFQIKKSAGLYPCTLRRYRYHIINEKFLQDWKNEEKVRILILLFIFYGAYQETFVIMQKGAFTWKIKSLWMNRFIWNRWNNI